MGGQTTENRTTPLCVGLLAHVDAGKTTLTEAMLYVGGALKKLGRVDHGDAFLDTDAQERERGITIFSKQAILPLEGLEVTLLDTPGHVDFSAEMERTLQVLDYAILVISGTDGVQSHTETLWRLLKQRGIPTFLFVNKMDLPGSDRQTLLAELKRRLDDGCCDCSAPAQEWEEDVATADEALLEQYLETGGLTDEAVAQAVAQRTVFPCYFGAALRLDGVAELLEGLTRYTRPAAWPPEFGAEVYKISRDGRGNRLTWLKVTGGCLRPKQLLTNRGTLGRNGRPVPEEEVWTEKVDQIRRYSGQKFRQAEAAPAGTVCAVTGLTHTFIGQGLGSGARSLPPALTPVLTYRVELPQGCNVPEALQKLRELEEEDPQLHIVWKEQIQEIHMQLMGEVQLEVLQRLIADRFGLAVQFSEGSILYRETITAPVEGVGHFEPLRHYAEVHLLLEPGARGSGLVFGTACSGDVLDRNWQRLILTHLEEKEHLGVLTGSPITDMRITLLTGRAHEKHTEGGDFRQATYRAVRQGLMQAESLLLEPWYDLRLELPLEQVGRAMTDLEQRFGSCQIQETGQETAVLTGSGPVSTLRGYQTELAAYTGGRGRLSATVSGYQPCHNPEEVIAGLGYQPEADLANTPDSVFCAHGAGFVVNWRQVPEYMHLPPWQPEQPEPEEEAAPIEERARRFRAAQVMDKELEAIFAQTYGPVKQRRAFESQARIHTEERQNKPVKLKEQPIQTEYLLVDGYNIIFAWDELKALARENLSAARDRLLDILCNYRGMRRCEVIVVFDAYKVKGGVGSVERYRNIHVVYTKEAETADMYIEKATLDLSKHHRVRVATSDGLEQVIILGHGSLRISARTLWDEVQEVEREIAQALGG
ncbi:MAG: TetM/TetW/TetO/TetS family tetracycline resistance ribosomal protection protein [Clostridiales bacterium]|nr:TetM/TetW/TetO/TetS family tetracycline resistance ribosomal protection protein [Clostridiales bacterium]